MISAKNLLVISRVRLARLGRQVLILEIMGSNPIRGTNKKLPKQLIAFSLCLYTPKIELFLKKTFKKNFQLPLQTLRNRAFRSTQKVGLSWSSRPCRSFMCRRTICGWRMWPMLSRCWTTTRPSTSAGSRQIRLANLLPYLPALASLARSSRHRTDGQQVA